MWSQKCRTADLVIIIYSKKVWKDWIFCSADLFQFGWLKIVGPQIEIRDENVVKSVVLLIWKEITVQVNMFCEFNVMAREKSKCCGALGKWYWQKCLFWHMRTSGSVDSLWCNIILTRIHAQFKSCNYNQLHTVHHHVCFIPQYLLRPVVREWLIFHKPVTSEINKESWLVVTFVTYPFLDTARTYIKKSTSISTETSKSQAFLPLG